MHRLNVPERYFATGVDQQEEQEGQEDQDAA